MAQTAASGGEKQIPRIVAYKRFQRGGEDETFSKASGLVVVLSGTTTLAPRTPTQAPPGGTAQTQKSPAASLGVFVYPKNNQSQTQQGKDEKECYGWAKQQTGIDPTAPPPAPTEADKKKGGGAKGAAGGAAGGAAIGAIAGDAGKGAAIGATAGAVHGRRQQKKANTQAEQQAQQNAKAQQQQTLDTFKKAFSTCMDGRHYSVK